MKHEDEKARRAHQQQRFGLYGVLVASGAVRLAFYLHSRAAIIVAGCAMLIALLTWAKIMARDPVGSDRADWPGHDEDRH